ncbi:MAG: ABC transporter permease [Solobacterium sp.]|nr:ABC transporter permease [Solobacterium sp.]
MKHLTFFESAKKVDRAGRLAQVRIYLGKFFRIFIYEADWKVLPMAVIVSALVAGVCVNVFVNMEATMIGSLAFACVCIWNGFFNSIQVVCRERKIIKREHRSGLHITSYIAAHMIYQAFICLCQVLIQLIVYKLCGYKYPTQGIITGSFVLDFGITLFLVTYAADMLALLVSCIVSNTTDAMTVVPFLLIVQLIFSGVAFPLEGAAEKISNFTISRWGIRTINTVANYNSMRSMTLYAAVNKLTIIPELKEIIEAIRKTDIWYKLGDASTMDARSVLYEFTPENVMHEWGILFLMAMVFAVLGTLILERIDYDKR